MVASVTKSVLYRLFTSRLNMSALEARLIVDEIEESRKFDTEAQLLAATLNEGDLAYASDTGNVFRRGSASTDLVGAAGVEIFATEVALLASTPADGNISYAQDTDRFFFRKNGAFVGGLVEKIFGFRTRFVFVDARRPVEVAEFHADRDPHRQIDQIVVEKRHARFQAMRHAHLVFDD